MTTAEQVQAEQQERLAWWREHEAAELRTKAAFTQALRASATLKI